MRLGSLTCSGCGARFPDAVDQLQTLTACPGCGAGVTIMVFPALTRPETKGNPGQAVVAEGEAGCFFHPQKRAVVSCDNCGRFLCGLCDMELNRRHLCPGCLESGVKKKSIPDIEDQRVLYNRQALILSIVPLYLTGIAALYLALRYWKAPGSLVTPRRWAMPVALVLASVQTLAFTLAIIAAFAS